ncbi:TadE/TadG family type IV pilus assembly protein [Ruegeria sp. SCP11]|uniref:TadE/TadG family type IV pilus assembly protein n=1 Tax=Ruegeria sp. SCP11 TaxID=3141378 RepID=UPI0033367583
MTRHSSGIRRLFGGFTGRENGSLTTESVIVFPIFVWAITLTYTYFDGFRESTANLKAAYTVSDLISREGEVELTDAYALSMYSVFNRMVRDNSALKMRLSYIRFVEGAEGEEDTHSVLWTTRCGYNTAWTDDNVNKLAAHLPEMADLDTLIVVETSKDYVPLLTTGWLNRDHKFNNLIFTRPRFAPKIESDFSPTFCPQDLASENAATGA